MTLNYYKVKAGDQIFRIMRDHYGDAAFFADQAALTDTLVKNNPHIQDINMIFPGQVVMFPETQMALNDAPMCLAPQDAWSSSEVAQKLSSVDQSTFDALIAVGASRPTNAISGALMGHLDLAATNAIKNVQKIEPAYWDMRAKTITRGQYDYARRKAIKAVDGDLGIYRKLITPGKTSSQVLRIDRSSLLRTNKLTSEIGDLQRIAKTAKQGAAILKYIDIPITMAKVHTAQNNADRTAIVIVDGTSIAAGLGAGALAVVLFGTPVGWVGLAAVATFGIAGSLVGEEVGEFIANETLYDTNGHRINTQMDKAWKPFYGPQ